MRTPAFRGTLLSRRAVRCALPLLLLLLLPALGAHAGAVSFMFGGDGVYPKQATENSQRWFRTRVTWDTTINADKVPNERPLSVRFSGPAFNDGFIGKDTPDEGVVWFKDYDFVEPEPDTSIALGKDQGVARYQRTSSEYVFTVGPFSAYNWDYLVGKIGSGGSPIASYTYSWTYQFQKWDGNAKKYVTQPSITIYSSYSTVKINPTGGGWVSGGAPAGELMYWYSSDASNIPPLEVTPQDPGNPNQGSSSATYKFRVVLWNKAGGTRPFITDPLLGSLPTFRATSASAMPGENYPYCRFERYAANILAGNPPDTDDIETHWDNNYATLTPPASRQPNPYRDWGYITGGGGKFDEYGSHQAINQLTSTAEGEIGPECLLIIDRKYDQPYYMVVDPSVPFGKAGEVLYRYDLKPTDYMQIWNNILNFPFDLFGSDAWDGFAEFHRGSPVSNNYCALGPGPHTYEFVATRDWDPPVARVVDYQTATVGIGKMMRCIVGRPGKNVTTFDLTTGVGGNDRLAVAYAGDIAGAITPDGFGYPYDSQSGNYPKVNPFLGGWPAAYTNLPFSSGYSYPFNMTPSTTPPPIAGEPMSIEPWLDEVGPHSSGYNMPGAIGNITGRVTNDDTISPNWANNWLDAALVPGYQPGDEYDPTKPAPFRGGKWTTETNYILRCVYVHSDNLPPQAVQVWIRKTNAAGTPTSAWVARSMQKVYASDNNYTDGAIYYYESSALTLPGGGGPGDYQYYFSCSDGHFTALYPNRPATDTWPPTQAHFDPGSIGVPAGGGPERSFYWFRVNSKPTLSGASLSPNMGTQGTEFVFKTTYTDQDGMVRDAGHKGDKPYRSRLWIDMFGDFQGQMIVDSIVGNTVNYSFLNPPVGGGVAYTQDLKTLYAGTTAKVSFQTGPAQAKEFKILSNSGSGATGSIVVDADLSSLGIVAGNRFQVVAFFPVTMTQTDPAADNYTSGVQFDFSTARAGMQLDPGTHPYYLEYWDNWFYWINWNQYFMVANTPIDGKVEGEMVRLPAAPNTYFDGPTVGANRAPKLSRYYFAPPAADTVGMVSSASELGYVRPLGRSPYLAGALNGKYLTFMSGLARGRVYLINSNTTTTLNLTKVGGAGDLISDRVVLGDTFRIFNAWSAAASLGGAYHQNPGNTYDGTPGTDFTLYFTYADQDNDAPVAIRLATYSTEPTSQALLQAPDAIWEVTKVDPTDTNFVDGCEYRSLNPVNLTPGLHWFMAQAFDGNDWANAGLLPYTLTGKDFVGPTVDPATPVMGPNVIINHAPNPPVSGFSPANGVTINTATPNLRWDPASDPDPGDSVVAYIVQLSKTGFNNDSFDYQYSTTNNNVDVTNALSDLTTWSWRVKSQDTLGAQSVWSEIQTFYVDLLAPTPVLSPPGGDPTATLSPMQGDLSTNFTYTITYSNASGTPPPSGVYVVIDGVLYPTPLTKDPLNNNFVAGVNYSITIRGDSPALGYGRHTYRFYTGAVSWPLTGAADAVGPWIGIASSLMLTNSSWSAITTLESGNTLYVQVSDGDENEDSGVAEIVPVHLSAASGDQEDINLTETGPNTGIFRGSIATLNAAGLSGDGVLNTPVGATPITVTATYTDPDFVDAPVPDVATASVSVVDTIAPPPVQPFLNAVSGPQGVSINLDWSGYTPPVDVAGYHIWLSTSPFADATGLVPNATVAAGTTLYTIPNLNPTTQYYVGVSAFDRVPNENKTLTGMGVTTVDTVGPTFSNLSPANGAINVPRNTTISCTASDPSGINLGSLQVKVNNVDVTSLCTFNPAVGTPLSTVISYTGTFSFGQSVTVYVQGRDTLTNFNDVTWSFTIVQQVASTVSGNVLDWLGRGVENVTISDGFGHTTTTDSNGHYILSDMLGSPLTLTPSLSGWSFAPASRTVDLPYAGSINFTAYNSYSVDLPAGTAMIGVPFDPPDRDPTVVFGTTRIRRWNPAGTPPAYVAPGDPLTAAVLQVYPGRGYFVNFSTAHTINGAGVPVSTASPFAIPLGANWNMIANPFTVPLPFSNLTPVLAGGVTPYCFAYDPTTGSYLYIASTPGVNVARTYILPWEGVWIRSLVGPTTITATAPVGPAQLAAPQSLDTGGGYVVPIVAKAGKVADLCSAAGVTAQGAFKVQNPPRLPESVDLYFLDESGTPLAQFLKPASAGVQSWSFVVSTDLPNTEVAVSLPDLSQVPNNLSVTLIDEDSGASLYMRTLAQYVFTTGADGAVRHFRLEVGPRGANELAITAASAQNTSTGVVVSYSVSSACQVNIDVLNIAGRVIRRVVTGQAAAAGVNSQVWNLRNDAGAPVPAGLYLLRIEAAADNGQRVQAVTQVGVNR